MFLSVVSFFFRKHGIPRPATIAAAQVLMVVGHILFAFACPGAIYISPLLIGLGIGVTYGMVTAATSEIFGLASFGMMYNIITSVIPLGSFLLSTELAARIYDAETEREAGPNRRSRIGASLRGGGWSETAQGNGIKVVGETLRNGADYVGWDEGGHGVWGAGAQTKECVGAHCFQLTFLVLAGVCVVGAVANAVLAVRTRKMYKRLARTLRN